MVEKKEKIEEDEDDEHDGHHHQTVAGARIIDADNENRFDDEIDKDDDPDNPSTNDIDEDDDATIFYFIK